MINKFLIVVWLVLSAGMVVAADLPKVSVYYTSPGDTYSEEPIAIFKLSNPTAQTFYILGMTITDVNVQVQMWKKEGWVDEPRFRCDTGSTFYPLLPGASMLFQVSGPDQGSEKWRAKLFLCKKADPLSERVIVYSPTVQITEPMRD